MMKIDRIVEVERRMLCTFKLVNPTMRKYTINDYIYEALRKREGITLHNLASFPSFYSLKMPTAKTGGNELMDTTLGMPRSKVKRKIMPMLSQFRWAMSYGVGGESSIDFVCRRGGN
tara:strand:+ start:685 stop:1035 length:351 start_codon:yes stop_codon:yes gene_type:complete